MADQRDDRAAEKPPPAPRGSSPTPRRQRFWTSPRWIAFFLGLLALNLFISARAMEPASRVRVPYSPFFLHQVETRNVDEITSKGTDIQGTFKKQVSFEDSNPTTRFRTEIPAFANTDELSRLLQENDVTVNAEPLETGAPLWQTLVFGFGPTLLFILLLVWLFRRMGNVQSALGSFGRSRARRYQPSEDKVTFADVAGIEEAKAELTEVVDFLRHPEKYRKLGGRIPHGVLLSGPPGTGKTLLARAVAGEAEVPFFSMAASEFVEAILRVHTRGVPLGPDVDLARIAATTPGMVGADLANLVNEAALTAARRGHDLVEQADFTDSLERILLGAERQVLMSDQDRRRTAYHEGGHAIVGMLTPGADPVRKVSIIPRGLALGVTFSAPDADRFNYLEPEIRAKIKVALGGRVAEEIVYGEISTGAESDIEQLTGLARQMIGRWGMSEAVGPISVIPRDGSRPFLPGAAEASPETHKLLDDEVRRIVGEAHDEVVTLLTENRARLDALVSALLEHETLDEDDAYAAAGVTRPRATPIGELTAAARSRT